MHDRADRAAAVSQAILWWMPRFDHRSKANDVERMVAIVADELDEDYVIVDTAFIEKELCLKLDDREASSALAAPRAP